MQWLHLKKTLEMVVGDYLFPKNIKKRKSPVSSVLCTTDDVIMTAAEVTLPDDRLTDARTTWSLL